VLLHAPAQAGCNTSSCHARIAKKQAVERAGFSWCHRTWKCVRNSERRLIAREGNRGIGRIYSRRRGWTGTQWRCLDALWSHESGWQHRRFNMGGSGAYGIPQALPGAKMASHGSDWETNPVTQIRWGLDYIAGRYGAPCAALGSLRSRNWY
jgi:hypothetical protein